MWLDRIEFKMQNTYIIYSFHEKCLMKGYIRSNGKKYVAP